MDYVNVQVAVGGDRGNTVPKHFVPVSEIPVLMALHGVDALFDFEQVDPPENAPDLGNREELQRLASIYGQVTDRDGNNVLRGVYGGAGARVVRDIDELELEEGAFKPVTRAAPRAEKGADKDLDPKAAKAAKAAEAKAKKEAEAAAKAEAEAKAKADAEAKNIME